MASIANIVRTGTGRAGSERSWWAFKDDPSDPFTPWVHYSLHHYRTVMLKWRKHRHTGQVEILDWSVGNGSVSDQGGMNTAFRVLGAPFRYHRDARGGGARIRDLETGECTSGSPTFYYGVPLDTINQRVGLLSSR